MVHHQAQAPACAQVFVQHQPHVHRQADRVGQDGDEIWVAAGDALLNKPDSETGTHRGQVRKVAVGPQSEMVTGDGHASQQLSQKWRALVETDQGVVADQRCQRFRRRRMLQIKPVGI